MPVGEASGRQTPHLFRKVRTSEPERQPLADIVIMPGAPSSQCPHCVSTYRSMDFRAWPAIERRAGRWLYGCERDHRWFADGAPDRP